MMRKIIEPEVNAVLVFRPGWGAVDAKWLYFTRLGNPLGKKCSLLQKRRSFQQDHLNFSNGPIFAALCTLAVVSQTYTINQTRMFVQCSYHQSPFQVPQRILFWIGFVPHIDDVKRGTKLAYFRVVETCSCKFKLFYESEIHMQHIS